MNRLILGNSVLDWASDKLLDLLRRGTRPGTKGHRDPDRDIGILPLRHAVVSKPTPYQDANEEHPGNLRVLDEEPGEALCVFSIRSWSFLYARSHCLRNHLDGIAILQELRADGHHSLSGLDSFNRNRGIMGRPQLDLAQVGNQLAGAILRNHHRKLFGFRREWHDRTQGYRDGRARDLT